MNKFSSMSIAKPALACGVMAFAMLANASRGIEQQEAERIRLTGGLVSRSGEVLALKAANGRSATFVNQHVCGENGQPFDFVHCVTYEFIRHDAAHHGFLITASFYDGGVYEWVSDLTGTSTVIEGEPHFSPSGTEFAVVQANDSSGFNGIQIWSVKNGEIEKRFEHEPINYALYNFKAWTSDTGIALTMSTYLDHHVVTDAPARLEKNGSWELHGLQELSR